MFGWSGPDEFHAAWLNLATSNFDWFGEWVERMVTIMVTFAENRTATEMFEAFGVDRQRTADAISMTLAEAAQAAGGLECVRVGRHEQWVYAVSWPPGQAAEIVSGLSAGGREAFTLCYAMTVELFMYGRDGVLVSGFDVTVPNIRYGSNENHFDALMAQMGIFGDGRERSPAAAAELVFLAFGVELDQEMLERSLPAVVGRPRRNVLLSPPVPFTQRLPPGPPIVRQRRHDR